MRILLIAIQYPPSEETGAKRPWLLAKEFRRMGHEVIVIAQQECRTSNGIEKITIHTGDFGERVFRLAQHEFPGIGDPSFRTFWRAKALILDICLKEVFDAAILTGPPFFHFLLLPTLRRIGIAALLDYRDGWATDPYPFRGVKDKAFRWLGKLIEPMLFRGASAVVFISESLRKDHLSFLGLRSSHKAFVIPNGVDLSAFEQVEPIDLKQLLGFPADAKVCVYPGTLSPDIGADSFVLNLNTILKKNPKHLQSARFVFVGKTAEYAKYFDAEVLERYIRFLPPVPIVTAYGYMKGADFLLSLAGNEAQRLNRKIFEYAAASPPVLHIGNAAGETARIVRENQLGPIVPPNDGAALYTCLQEVIRSKPCVRQSVPFTTAKGAEYFVKIIKDLKTMRA